MADPDAGFLGRGWSFPPALDPATGRAVMVSAEDDIVESLRILISTRPGERIMQPDYGCRLSDLVFEPMGEETETQVETTIRQAILFFEPRITAEEIEVSTQDWLEGHLSVRIEYRVIQTNTRANMVFPFYQSEGTLVSDTPEPTF
ncbi:MAG: GPW/gp25 family protein [Pseudomonadota bacterium]